MIRKKYLQDNRALISRVIPASFRHPIKRKSVRSEYVPKVPPKMQGP